MDDALSTVRITDVVAAGRERAEEEQRECGGAGADIGRKFDGWLWPRRLLPALPSSGSARPSL